MCRPVSSLSMLVVLEVGRAFRRINSMIGLKYSGQNLMSYSDALDRATIN